jgi:hypothetical protein
MTKADYKPYEPRGAFFNCKKYEIPADFEKEDYEVFPMYDTSAPGAKSEIAFSSFMKHVQEMAEIKKRPITMCVGNKIDGERTIVVRPKNCVDSDSDSDYDSYSDSDPVIDNFLKNIKQFDYKRFVDTKKPEVKKASDHESESDYFFGI